MSILWFVINILLNTVVLQARRLLSKKNYYESIIVQQIINLSE